MYRSEVLCIIKYKDVENFKIVKSIYVQIGGFYDIINNI